MGANTKNRSIGVMTGTEERRRGRHLRPLDSAACTGCGVVAARRLVWLPPDHPETSLASVVGAPGSHRCSRWGRPRRWKCAVGDAVWPGRSSAGWPMGRDRGGRRVRAAPRSYLLGPSTGAAPFLVWAASGLPAVCTCSRAPLGQVPLEPGLGPGTRVHLPA
ncbi:hypothetical protein NDU88_003934 [Pleurodeles waltl]|uniref:Uncharacterized protein n=1 Tax=Pleurodeles waltl TaxID=8319 RepID=A0AAV7RH80_PLEWA|nr:hypothetical protein NDU88_003934 [Pleurodeles waltl]